MLGVRIEIFFVTGSQGKLAEARTVIPSIKSVNLDLPEIQEIDAVAVITAKLDAAALVKAQRQAVIVVEDTSLHVDCLGGLPGPLVKWFVTEQTMGIKGFADQVMQNPNRKATVVCHVGALLPCGKKQFFSAEVRGEIVLPSGSEGFGFDPIFKPESLTETWAEMSQYEKLLLSPRAEAFAKLAKALQL